MGGGGRYDKSQVINDYTYVIHVLNLRTVLVRPLWTHQRSTEE